MTRLRVAVAAFVAVLTVVLVCGVLVGWHRNADVLLWAFAAVGYVWFVVEDSSLRGRSGVAWLLLCVLIAPIGLLAFGFVSVKDRVRGRRGIEQFWAPGVRWCYLFGVMLAALALTLAVLQITVAAPRIPALGSGQAGFSRPATGSCDANAVGILLGKRPGLVSFRDYLPASQHAEVDGLEQRCIAAAGRRMVASEVSLAGGLALMLVGALNQRRRRLVPPPAPVPLGA